MMKAKMMAGGGKTKMAAGGGMMKKGYAAGGAMPMVEKDGNKVPAFAADGVGKMAKGGMAKAKMMAGGGMMSKMAPSKMSKVKTGTKPDGVAKKGLTKGKMVGMRGR
jgi:hypothetical protein